MQIRFWGTRGSLAKPGTGTLRYGGNTSCVEVRTASGTLIVLDCGTGAHSLGAGAGGGVVPPSPDI
jgi:phosphoribosyl 1,2-cyclic phosphodiesterase